MRVFNRWWMNLVMAGLVAALVGCRPAQPPNPPGPAPEPNGEQVPPENGSENGEPVPVEVPLPEELPPPSAVPEVLLTEQLLETCLKKVGDSMPEVELPDLEGDMHSLADLYGEKLTVLFFWTTGDSMFADQAAINKLESLQVDIAEPYTEQGVRVLAINEHDEAEAVRKLVEQAGAPPKGNFQDPEGTFFAELATEKLPRVYLLDAEGKILWFDLGFSEFAGVTRDNLKQAIEALLE